MINEPQLPKREDIEIKDELQAEPSLFLYLLLVFFGILLVFLAFSSKVDWPSFFLNLATEIFGAVIILLLVERKLRKTEVEYLRGTPQRIIDIIFFKPSIIEINNYLKKSGIRQQKISDYLYLSRPSLEKSIFSEKGCFVLLGNPGSGKTTLLQKYFLNIIKKAYESPRKAKIPIFLSLYNWDTNILSSLLDSIQRYTEFSQRTFSKLLKRNRIICILDGLDEVIEQNEILSKVVEFHRQYPKVQIIVSTRPHTNYYLLNDFALVKIPELSKEEINLFQDIIKKYKRDFYSS
jgi:hypothetical protein